MSEFRKLGPTLSALPVFVTAATHQSFTQAAAELGLTQPAVSHRIKQLERHLGLALFRREHRSLALTAAGEKLLADVSFGLGHVEQSIRTLQSEATASARVTLSISTAFATYWLLPRIERFKRAHPGIDLRFQTTSRNIDLTRAGIGLGVRQGDGRWHDHHAWRLFDEQVLAVCSPDFLGGELLAGPDALLARPLIHLDEPHRTRLNWNRWLRRFGLDADVSRQGLKLNDYAVVLQAAIEGQGVDLQRILTQVLHRILTHPVSPDYGSGLG